MAVRSLYIVLDDASVAQVRARAVHARLRGDHVTLAHAVSPDAFSRAWIPGGHALGDRVALRAVGQVVDARVQALVVSVAGRTERPYDGGTLHITVSVAEGARARESNALLEQQPPRPTTLALIGTVRWTD